MSSGLGFDPFQRSYLFSVIDLFIETEMYFFISAFTEGLAQAKKSGDSDYRQEQY